MPRPGVWLIRCALAHLLIGAIIGALFLGLKAYGWFPFVAAWRQAHVEQMLVGWMVQLVMGVAWWILPRTGDIARGGAPGKNQLIWLVLVLINTGVLLAALGTLPGAPVGLLAAGRIIEVAAAGLYAMLAWNRQRPYRAAMRRALV